jgi:hypothetical protein
VHLPLSPFFAVIRGARRLSQSLGQRFAILIRILRQVQGQKLLLLPDYT